MIGLKNRVHMFAHPRNRDRLIQLFTKVLDCKMMIAAPSTSPSQQILLFTFPNSSSLSVEFTEDVEDAANQKDARRGAWLELETDNPLSLKEKILEAGCKQFDYTPGFFYFQIPGGQVMRVKMNSGKEGQG